MPADMNPGALSPHAWLALLAGCVALFLQGVFLISTNRAGLALTGLCTASAATMWCVVDALRRGAYWHRAAQFYTFLLWPLAVPVYLIWSRGSRGVWFALVYLITIIALPLLGILAARILS